MLHMLIADDEAEEREGVLFLLQKYQWNIDAAQAPNGKAALEYLKNHPVDILFTDVRMPFMDGLALAKEALIVQPKLRVILFSGFSEFEYVKTAISLGVSEYILKPVNVEEFCRVIQRVSAEILASRSEEERNKRRWAYARMHLLYSLVNGTPLKALSEEAGALFDLSFLDQYNRLMLLECSRNFFESAGSALAEILKQRIPLEFDYLNLNACQSLLLFPASAGKRDWDALAADLHQFIWNRYQIHCCFAVSGNFSGGLHLSEVLEALEQQMEDRFFFPDTYVFSETTLCRTKAASPRTDGMLLDAVETALRERDPEAMRQNIRILCERYAGKTQLSHLHVKFVFSNLLQEISLYWSHLSEEALNEKIERIYRSSNYHEVADILYESLETQPQVHFSPHGYVETVKRYISAHYGQELNLESLAEVVYLTPRYLSSIFKRETGCGLNKYIKAFRMEKAKALLATTHMKVVAVCSAVGYTNVSYFIQSFREYFGSSPEKFRQKEE